MWDIYDVVMFMRFLILVCTVKTYLFLFKRPI